MLRARPCAGPGASQLGRAQVVLQQAQSQASCREGVCPGLQRHSANADDFDILPGRRASVTTSSGSSSSRPVGLEAGHGGQLLTELRWRAERRAVGQTWSAVSDVGGWAGSDGEHRPPESVREPGIRRMCPAHMCVSVCVCLCRHTRVQCWQDGGASSGEWLGP